MATAALVLGIIACVISVFGLEFGFIGSVCGVLAIVFGAISKSREPDSGKAKAGLILGIISFAWGIVMTVCCLSCAAGCAALMMV